MAKYSAIPQSDLNRVFKALSDPTRRTVVQRLTLGPQTVSALAEPFKMALPSFVQHLDVLEECGLVASEKTGRSRTYRLSPKPLQAAEDWMIAQRAIWDMRLNQLDSYLDKLYRQRQVSAQTNPPTKPDKE